VVELVGGRTDGSGAAPLLDERAKRDYAKRLAELEEERDQAIAWADDERAARIQDEIDALTRELALAVGLHGHDRGFASPAERARVNVTKAIKTAIRLIEKECPPLGSHLQASIQTGQFCSYSTRAEAPPPWSL
jgi:hypothetical protein